MDKQNEIIYAGDEEAVELARSNKPIDNTKFKRIIIVHISDTHGKEMKFLNEKIIPEGDILVHSGDIMQKESEIYHKGIREGLNEFFGLLPHKYKLFVAGNNEFCFKLPSHSKNNINNVSPEERKVLFEEERKHYSKEEIQSMIPNCIYLQDEGITIEGIRFYGSPWTTSPGYAFSATKMERKEIWNRIPSRSSSQSPVDVLITHMPSFGVLDRAWNKGYSPSPEQLDGKRCIVCGKIHENYAHWGCDVLHDLVANQIQPKLHLCGHIHDSNGVTKLGNSVVVNSAMDLSPIPHVIHFFLRKIPEKEYLLDEEDNHDWNFVPYVRKNVNSPLNIHHSLQPHLLVDSYLKEKKKKKFYRIIQIII